MPHPRKPRGTTRCGLPRILGCITRKRAGGPTAVQHFARPLSLILIVLPAAKALLIWFSGGPLSKNARHITFLIAVSVNLCRPALETRFARHTTLSYDTANGVEQHTPIARRDEHLGMGHVLLRRASHSFVINAMIHLRVYEIHTRHSALSLERRGQ